MIDPLPEPARRLLELAKRIGPELIKPLYPICSFENSTRPTPQASGLVIDIAGRRFLVTAAHVADLRHNLPLGVILANSMELLTGSWLSTRSSEPDRLDLAVLVPSSALARVLALNDAVPLQRLATLSPSRETARVTAAYYVTMGYPVSRQPRRLLRPEYEAGVWPLLSSGCDAGEYAAASASLEYHVLLEFDKDNVQTERGEMVAPDPNGASGGAVWWLRMTDRGFDPRLVAIPIVWRIRANQILATRMHVALAGIWREFPELRKVLDEAD